MQAAGVAELARRLVGRQKQRTLIARAQGETAAVDFRRTTASATPNRTGYLRIVGAAE